jgi:hypothetical protein
MDMHRRSYYYFSSGTLTNGEHVIHRADCPLMPGPAERSLLGIFNSPADAKTEGLKHSDRIKCCPFCINELHSTHNSRETQDNGFPGVFSSFDQIVPSPESGLMCCIN